MNPEPMTPHVLGISASLRNARWGAGNEELVQDLLAAPDEAALNAFLREQGSVHVQNFLDAGRAEGRPFDETYAKLRKLTGRRGLSNSEAALAAGLWAAAKAGSTIEHLSLTRYYGPTGKGRNLEALRSRLHAADAILLSGPVYFGDRGSLAQELVSLAQDDSALRGKVFAGLAVGAKRNGGQETTLVYQMFDMLNAGLLGVGNDSETTSQYGGTGMAGDVGSLASDAYGLATCMGTGRRVAQVADLIASGDGTRLRGKVRLLFWVLDDADGVGLRTAENLCARYGDQVEATILDLTKESVSRCIACDICPTHVSVDQEYRCIIRSSNDSLQSLHQDFLNHDAVIPVVRSRLQAGRSCYQRFLERTRYLRRGDYAIGDCLVAPLVIEDVGARQNMALRAMTSMVRHHTVLSRPLMLHLHEGKALNREGLVSDFEEFLARTAQLAVGRLQSALRAPSDHSVYNPVGYVLSAERAREDEREQRRTQAINERQERIRQSAALRLKEVSE